MRVMIGRHRRKRDTSTEQYAAMLTRMLRAYGVRIGADPVTGLAQLRNLETAMTDAVNLGLHTALESGRSATEMAGALGVSRQAIYKRARLGEQTARARQARPIMRAAAPRQLPPGSA
jgi:hypothetical protein